MYTYKNCFVITIRKIQTTNLIEHSIDLKKKIKFVKNTLSKYIQKKQKFANQIFSKLKNIEIILQRNSE